MDTRRQRLLALFAALLVLAACSGGADEATKRGPPKTATAPKSGAEAPVLGTSTGGDTGSPDAPLVPGGGGGAEAPFEQAGTPTPIGGAYLTAFRDAPSSSTAASDFVLVYAVLSDGVTKLPLPKSLAIEEAFVRFDGGGMVKGERDTDPKSSYHVRFRVPKTKIAGITVGKDRIVGAIQVKSSALADPTLETSIVIWLSNVALVSDRIDYGTVVVPPAGVKRETMRISVSVSAKEQPAQGALLKGLGADLEVVGGTCPTLSETVPVDLVADCDVALAPKEATVLDRVLTLSYYNGIRSDFASVIIRGEAAVIVGEGGGTGVDKPWRLLVQDGKLIAADAAQGRVLIWNEVPKRSKVAPDVTLTGLNDPRGLSSDGTRLFVASQGLKRLLIWNAMPTTNAKAHDLALATASYAQPLTSVGWDGTHLFAGSADDLGYAWTGVPTLSPAGDVMILTSTYDEPYNDGSFRFAPGGETYRMVGNLGFDGTRYHETLQDRVRFFDSWSLDLSTPSFVLGDTDPTKHLAYGSLLSQVWSDGTRIVWPDGDVRYWSKFPAAATTAPEGVVRSREASEQGENEDGPSADDFLAYAAAISGERLVHTDSRHGRILIRPLPGPRPTLELPLPTVAYGDGESAPGLIGFTERYVQLGSFDILQPKTVELALRYTGTTPATVVGTTLEGEELTFVGGAFPGTGGTCGTAIAASCFIRVVLTPKLQREINATVRVTYDNQIETREALITLVAAPRYYAKRVEKPVVGLERYPIGPGGAPGRFVFYDDYWCDDIYEVGLLTTVGTPRVTDGAHFSNPNECGEAGLVQDAAVVDGRLYAKHDHGHTSVWSDLANVDGQAQDTVLEGMSLAPVAIFGGLYGVGQCDLVGWATPPTGNFPPHAVKVSPNAVTGSACFAAIMKIGGALVAVDQRTGGKVDRLLVWTQAPTTVNPLPNRVIELTAAYRGRWTSDGTRFYASDTLNDRVLGWNALPAASSLLPDLVLGQLAVDSVTEAGNGLAGIVRPTDLFAQDGELFIHESSRSRYVVYTQP